MIEQCGTCKWLKFEKDVEDWSCSNPESEYYADWISCDCSCDCWEERDG